MRIEALILKEIFLGMYGRTYGSMDIPSGGGGQMSCSCAKTLHETLDVLHRKGVDFDQFMVISVL